MGHRTEVLKIDRLLLDVSNARLGVEQKNQRETEKSLAVLIGDQLVNLAKDIVENGTDPISTLAVVPFSSDDGQGKFVVLEGNRRLLAIRSLLNPGVVSGVVSSRREKKIKELSEAFSSNPIRELPCVVFEEPDEAWHWINLRHTGANGGVGMVAWSADDQDRWRSRHLPGGSRTPAGQIIDLVDSFTGSDSRKGIITNLDRLISTKEVRDRIGVEIKNKVVYAHYPLGEMLKVLTYIVDDLSSGAKNVKDVYYKKDRLKYISEIPEDIFPKGDFLLGPPTPLSELEESGSEPSPGDTPEGRRGPGSDGDSGYNPGEGSGGSGSVNADEKSGSGENEKGGSDSSEERKKGKENGNSESTGRSSRSKVRPARNSVIPRNFVVYIPDGRINEIYHELKKLEMDNYPNACAVLFRVFVELSVDSYIGHFSVISEQERRSLPLAKRMKKVGEHLLAAGKIDSQFERAVVKIADGVGPLGTSTTTFNQYVHNNYVFPKPTELRTAWDELEPFVQKVWMR